MAMNGQQQNNKGIFEPSYYSRLRWKNEESKLTLSVSFWKGLLKLSITQAQQDFSGSVNIDEIAYIHLSSMKASIMAQYVEKIINDKNSTDILGVNTGSSETQGLIAVSRDTNGVPYLFIGKVDGNGKYLSSQKFLFNHKYNYGLNIKSLEDLKFDKEYMDELELQQLHDLFEDYARSSNGALGFSVHDVARYEEAKASDSLFKIMTNLGIKGGGKSGNSSNSFFAKDDSNAMNLPEDNSNLDLDDF